jgi:hypothetical protein
MLLCLHNLRERTDKSRFYERRSKVSNLNRSFSVETFILQFFCYLDFDFQDDSSGCEFRAKGLQYLPQFWLPVPWPPGPVGPRPRLQVPAPECHQPGFRV